MTRRKLARRTTNKKASDWFEKPWTKIIGALTTIFLLFGTGFTVGIYIKEIDCNLDQMKIRQEFNEKMLDQMTSCQNEKLNKYETTVDELKTIIDNLNNSQNEEE